jgi:hypothetical protein
MARVSITQKDPISFAMQPEGKRVWKSVGKDAQFALADQLKHQKSFEATVMGIRLVEDVPAAKQTVLSEAVA